MATSTWAWAKVVPPKDWAAVGDYVYLMQDKDGFYVQYPTGLTRRVVGGTLGTFLAKLASDGFEVLSSGSGRPSSTT